MKKKIITAIYLISCFVLLGLSVNEFFHAKATGEPVNMFPILVFTFLPLTYSSYLMMTQRKNKKRKRKRQNK